MIRRTAAITAASIAGVILAGGAAVGANIGILNAADDNSLGELSAVAPVTTASTEPSFAVSQVVEGDTSSDSTQTFEVDTAGTVDIEFDDTGLRLGDVRTNEGWSWEQTQSNDAMIRVVFSSGTDRLEFSATSNSDGSIDALVERPFTASAAGGTTTDPGTHSYDDEHEHDEHDEPEHDEHEGREDDD